MSDSNQPRQFNHNHTNEVQEIINKVPSWIVRYGIMIFSAILLMALSVSAVIRYPDMVKSPVKIQSIIEPGQVFAEAEVDQANFIKVKVGQHVLVHLQAFTSSNNAPVAGTVVAKAETPNPKGLFPVKIKLTANPKHPLKLKNWMTGTVDIITQDITVFQRIFQVLLKH